MSASTMPPDTAHLITPSIFRRVATLPYEALLLLALIVIASFPAAGLKGATLYGTPHLIFQAYLLLVSASYFTWFWRHGGQTLAMKTWHFRVVDHVGQKLNLARALARFVLASFFYGPACVGVMLFFFPDRISRVIVMWTFLPMLATLLWARFDTDGQFLHDRMAGTRLVNVPA